MITINDVEYDATTFTDEQVILLITVLIWIRRLAT